MSGVEKWSEKQNISAYILIRNENQVIFFKFKKQSNISAKTYVLLSYVYVRKIMTILWGKNKTYLKSPISILEDAERKRLNQTIVSYYSYRGDILVYLKWLLPDLS